MYKELKEFINRIFNEQHSESELSDDLKKKIEEKLDGPHTHGVIIRFDSMYKRERSKHQGD